MIKMTFAR